jgi:pimeloyl-ACP methyl ester carboxylesterase
MLLLKLSSKSSNASKQSQLPMKAIKQYQGLCTTYDKMKVNNSKRWVVIIHGWDTDGSNSWSSTGSYLNQKGFNVLLLDLPGFGKSESPQDVWGTNEYARFVDGFVKELGVEPLIVVGHAFGGAVAARMVSSKKNSYKGLVLVAPALEYQQKALTFSQRQKQKARKVYTTLSKNEAIGPMLRQVRNAVKYFFGATDYQKSESKMQRIMKKILAEESLSSLNYISIPTIVVWGTKDLYTPIDNANKVVSNLQQGELVVYDGSHHRLQLVASERLASDVVEFFDKNKYSFAFQ